MDEFNNETTNNETFNNEAGQIEKSDVVETVNPVVPVNPAINDNVNPYMDSLEFSTVRPMEIMENPENVGKRKKNKKVKAEKKKKGFVGKFFSALACGLIFGIALGAGYYGFEIVTERTPFWKSGSVSEDLYAKISDLQAQIDSIPTSNAVITTSGTNTSVVANDVTDVVDAVMPAMVSVTNLYEETVNYWGRRYTQENQASGSGIIIGENDEEFLIVTNYHVIENSVQLTITFVDEEQADAYVKGYDSSVDIAVIAVKKANLKTTTKKEIRIAVMGDSETLRIGETAIAIGNALGYGQSVTTGVISALNRDIEMENTCSRLIQTSAAINPGNSGGALLNIKGEVIGINSNKIGGTTVESMGYAIPISEVSEIIENLSNRETREKVDEQARGYLGISGQTVDETLINYGFPEGVYVKKVYENSAAEAAGLIVGDIINKIEGQSVLTIAELQEALAYYHGGDTVEITIMRATTFGYEEMTLSVSLSDKTVLGE